MLLSEAIRKGSEHTKQGFGSYREVVGGEVYCCAIGAAHLAAGISSYKDEETFPILKEPCVRPLNGEMSVVHRAIVDLNDELKWTRERIADWVAEQERRLGSAEPTGAKGGDEQ